jgi:hypothetical protein
MYNACLKPSTIYLLGSFLSWRFAFFLFDPFMHIHFPLPLTFCQHYSNEWDDCRKDTTVNLKISSPYAAFISPKDVDFVSLVTLNSPATLWGARSLSGSPMRLRSETRVRARLPAVFLWSPEFSTVSAVQFFYLVHTNIHMPNHAKIT